MMKATEFTKKRWKKSKSSNEGWQNSKRSKLKEVLI